MKENLESKSFLLAQEDVEKITALNKNKRFHEPSTDQFFNFIPFFD